MQEPKRIPIAAMDEEESERASQGKLGKIATSSKGVINNFEEILDHIGGWGLYQIRLLFFMWVVVQNVTPSRGIL